MALFTASQLFSALPAVKEMRERLLLGALAALAARPAVATVTWVLGGAGKDCDEVCGQSKICNTCARACLEPLRFFPAN